MTKQKVYSVADIAGLMKVCTQTVRRWLRAGRLGGKRIVYGYVVTDKQLKKFLGATVYEAIITKR